MVDLHQHAVPAMPYARSAKTDWALSAVMIAISVITVYPFYYVLICSISSPTEVLKMNVSFLPRGFYPNSYVTLVQNPDMWRSMLNSVVYVVSGTVLNCATAILGAYPLSVRNMIWRKWVVRYFLVAMYFSGGIIPLYILISQLGLYNTYLSVIVPGIVSIWNIMIARAYFAGIPDSLRESAHMDGASHFQIMAYIYVPLSKAVLAVIAIYSIVGIWNGWFSSLLFQPNADIQPLQMYLYRVLIKQTVDLSKLPLEQQTTERLRIIANSQLKYAMIIFTSVPIIMTYPFFQRYFIQGVMLGSLKE